MSSYSEFEIKNTSFKGRDFCYSFCFFSARLNLLMTNYSYRANL
jgi:hypothetical protein